jgi:hypothetical protein
MILWFPSTSYERQGMKKLSIDQMQRIQGGCACWNGSGESKEKKEITSPRDRMVGAISRIVHVFFH